MNKLITISLKQNNLAANVNVQNYDCQIVTKTKTGEYVQNSGFLSSLVKLVYTTVIQIICAQHGVDQLSLLPLNKIRKCSLEIIIFH